MRTDDWNNKTNDCFAVLRSRAKQESQVTRQLKKNQQHYTSTTKRCTELTITTKGKKYFQEKRRKQGLTVTFARNPSDLPIGSKQLLAIITTGIGLSRRFSQTAGSFKGSLLHLSSACVVIRLVLPITHDAWHLEDHREPPASTELFTQIQVPSSPESVQARCQVRASAWASHHVAALS